MLKKKESSQNLSNKISSSLDQVFNKYRYLIFIFLLGIIFLLIGLFIFKSTYFSGSKIEVLDEEKNLAGIVVEIAGEVIKPGVYKLDQGSRIEDLLVLSGGVSENADREWMDKSLNRAAIINDGQKIYIPNINEQSDVLSANQSDGDQTVSSNFSDQGSGFIDLNSATQKELESLNGIGPVYAQKITEHRPYSNTQEIVTKAGIPQKTYEKIKDQITVF